MTQSGSPPPEFSASLHYSRVRSAGSMRSYHQHGEYELAVLLTGSGWFYAASDIIRMVPGHMYIARPALPHMMVYSDQTPHTMYHISFHPSLLSELKDEFSLDVAPLLDRTTSLPLGEELQQRLAHTLSPINRRTGGSEIDNAVRRLLVKCVLLTMARQLGLDQPGEEPASHPIVRSVADYIETHFSEDITLDALSEYASLNKSYLCRLFRRETGLTVNEYLNSVRIRNACQMLRNGDRSISEVSLLSGYNSAAYFARQFRAQLGMSPTAFMRDHHIGPAGS